jgi:hypothetical protein
MNNKHARLLLFLILAFLVAVACNLSLPQAVSPGPTQGLIYTQAASTFYAQATDLASQATPTEPATATSNPQTLATATETLVPTLTFTPLPSPTPIPSFTPLPSATPGPTATRTLPPGATPVTPPAGGSGSTGPCNAAKFMKDVTIPDGTEMSTGESFEKTWRLLNVGTCTWTQGYGLVFVKGDPMGAPTHAVQIPYPIKPGQYVDASVGLVAPGETGTYQGNWMLQTPSGQRFGIGSNYNSSFYVKIKVTEAGSGQAYNFANSMCAASWESDAASLPCPGTEGDPDGFVLYLDNPNLENRHENEPTLWTNPNFSDDGWIKGTYPSFTVKSGDHFMAVVGCLADFPKCNVVFELGYLNEAGKYKKINEWAEKEDGSVTNIDVGLASLADKSVQFVLTVNANGNAKDDAAFWFQPHIERP